MNKTVILKRNKYGFRLLLDPEPPFSELLSCIRDTFRENGDFFRDARMALTIEGRALTREEEKAVVSAIESVSSVHIACLMDQDKALEETMRKVLNAHPASYSIDGETEWSESSGFYRGNLRSGQVLECFCSITLIGDVNPGAAVVSHGNIVILGSLKGKACAGAGGDQGCFIFALDMNPIQLQIGSLLAKSPDPERRGRFLRRKETQTAYTPSLALVRDGDICIEPVQKDSFKFYIQ